MTCTPRTGTPRWCSHSPCTSWRRAGITMRGSRRAPVGTVPGVMMTQFEILDVARSQVLPGGEGLTAAQTLDVLRRPDEALDELLELAHQVRMRGACGVPKLDHGR